MYKNLIHEMKKNGFTQSEVARVAMMADSSFSDCLHGRMKFKLDQAIAIRDSLFPGMNIDYLFAPAKKEEMVK